MRGLKRAKLVLEDKSIFGGESFGFQSSAAGEVVFNTGMVGYPETLTDPSYRGQILVLTYPLVGNYGVPPFAPPVGGATGGKPPKNDLPEYFESDRIQISGLILSDYSFDFSHWNAKESLQNWLVENKIPALTDVDTRSLTKNLREKGVMLGKIVIGKNLPFFDPNSENLMEKVSLKSPKIYKSGSKKVVLFDCGLKNNIIRSLLKRNLTVIRVPWDFDIFNANLDFEAVVISNGPGDPKKCNFTIEMVKKAMKKNLPIFGICLGNQILALSAGGITYKLKYGHRGQNQPVLETNSNRCYITSQNHGYAVDVKSLSHDWAQWFRNQNDGTNEGIFHRKKPFFSVQFHPEATPGPTDTNFLFDFFAKIIH